MNAPPLSVVVCTYNRARLLRNVLETLCLQTLDHAYFEVIVVDNNSTDDTAAVVTTLARTTPNLRYVLETQVGLSHARNRGWREARGEYVGYTDDDCKVPHQWLEVAWNVLVEQQPAVLGGPYYAFYDTPKPAWFKDSYGSRVHNQGKGVLAAEDSLHGGNLFIRRAQLAELGGFRVDLGMTGGIVAYGEETALLEQLRHSMPGEIIYYAPDLFVYHLVRPEKMAWPRIIRQQFASGRDYYRVFSAGSASPASLRSLVWMARHALRNLLKSALIDALRRDRISFPYVQQYWYERSLNHVWDMGVIYARWQEQCRPDRKSL